MRMMEILLLLLQFLMKICVGEPCCWYRIQIVWVVERSVRPEGCFIAQYKDVSNYVILVIRRGFYSVCLTFSRDCYRFTFNEGGEEKSYFSFPHF